MDFYKEVPQTLQKNLQYRIEIRKRAQRDKGFQKALMAACREDVLYFFSAFCWLYEPRPRFKNGVMLPNVFPFIPWEHQVPVIRELRARLGFEDIGGKKSRGQGFSWIGALLAKHDWIFRSDVTIGMCSSTEEKSDKPNDRGSLLGKLDWEMTMLPRWMVGVEGRDWIRNKSDHTFSNLRNNSLIVSSAATAGTGRGHRYFWFFLDEVAEWRFSDAEGVLASLQHATDSRLFGSTPHGSSGPYYDIMHEPSSMYKVVLGWTQNPVENRGLYRFLNEKPVAVDPKKSPLFPEYDPPNKETLDLFSRLRRKGFKLDGKLRSPWYDHECDRTKATPQSIAQELDMDFGGSMYRIFGTEFFEKAQKSVRPPKIRGLWGYHPQTLEPDFDKDEGGPFLLWCPLDMVKNRPPQGSYVVAADISSGLGGSYTSNSVLQVVDLLTMEQVAEYATNTVPPMEFAETAVSVAKWFWDAYLIFELNGPGAAFAKRMLDLRYANVYRRPILWRPGKKKRKEVGWWTDDKTKELMFGELSRAVKTGELVLRSDLLVKECGQYVRINGKIEHVLALSTKDDSSKGKAHGDRVISMACALQAARDRPLSKEMDDESGQKIPPYSMAARQREYEASQVEEDDVWDGRTNWDLAQAS